MIRGSMISDLAIDVDAEAVVVRAERALRAVSSAIVGGGLVQTRAIVNLHVPKGFQCADSEGHLAEFARRRAVPSPFVGLLTGAATDRAELATEQLNGLSVSAVVTVGLSNRSAAGRSAQAMWRPSTINTIVIVDAEAEDAALVNLVITATEAKALALAEAGVATREGGVVTGTSTDAVVVAATGRGPRCRFGGPVSDLGWLVARAVKSALDAGVARWIAEAR
jgi:iron complex transport system ATP-binding protein